MRLWVFKRHFSTIFQYILTFELPCRKESTLTNTHLSQNVLHVHLEKCKKKSLNIHSHV
jgi:hypothetical protein